MLDNYIYYSITEKTYELFLKSNFNTFSSFCSILSTSIRLKEFSYNEKDIFFKIVEYIINIYGLERDDATKYVFEYFDKNKYLIFFDTVIFMFSFFKESYN